MNDLKSSPPGTSFCITSYALNKLGGYDRIKTFKRFDFPYIWLYDHITDNFVIVKMPVSSSVLESLIGETKHNGEIEC